MGARKLESIFVRRIRNQDINDKQNELSFIQFYRHRGKRRIRIKRVGKYMRLIDADKLKKAIIRNFHERNVYNLIDKQPTIEQPRWISLKEDRPKACETVLYRDEYGVYFGWILSNGNLFLADEELNITECEIKETTMKRLCWMPLQKVLAFK